MRKITVIGAGTMGNGIVHSFAQFGYEVTLVGLNDAVIKNALLLIGKNMERQVNKGVISLNQKEASLNRISYTTDLANGLREADMAIEAVTENYDIKRAVFKDMDVLAPQHAILASNTSSISITKIAAQTQRPDRIIGMHFMNPVPMMNLVEVVRGYQTSESCVKQVIDLAKSLQKTPIAVNDYPGFVANRILIPMINESVYTLFEGIAGVQEIDTIMKLGMAHPMGPLRLADFIGLDVCLSILEVLHQGFKQAKYAPCPLLVNMVAAGQLGMKAGVGFYDYSTDPKNPTIAKNFRQEFYQSME
nr:3-hydroxyacyl-CoA dehydrogenase NAD-binding domain-containing protein [Olivibacter sitiensis]